MKKILVSILSVLMVLALAAPVSAEDPEGITSVTPLSPTTIMETDKFMEELKTGSVTLTGAVLLDEPLNITTETTINLNNWDIFPSDSWSGDVNNSSGKGNLINIDSGAKVVFNGKGEIGSRDKARNVVNVQYGTVEFHDVQLYHSSAQGAPLNINGGSVTLFGETTFGLSEGSWYAIGIESKNNNNAALVLDETAKINTIGVAADSKYLIKIDGLSDLNKESYDVTINNGASINHDGNLIAQEGNVSLADVVEGEENLGLVFGNDGKLTKAVVDVNGTKYASLEEALPNITQGVTITLLADTSVDEKLVINKDGITLNLGGFKLSASADFTKGTPLLEVQKANNIIIKNGTLEASETTKHVVNIWQSGSITLEGVTLDHSKGADGAPLVVVGGRVSLVGEINLVTGPKSWYGMNLETKYDASMKQQSELDFTDVTKLTLSGDKDELLKIEDSTDKDNIKVMTTQKDLDTYAPNLEKAYGQVENVNGSFVKVEPSTDPTPEKPSRPTYRPSSPSKDLPSNTKECQKEFGDEYIWSDEYDACVIKFMIVDTSTK